MQQSKAKMKMASAQHRQYIETVIRLALQCQRIERRSTCHRQRTFYAGDRLQKERAEGYLSSEDANERQHLAISISPDRDGFIRHTCPSCGRDFKTEVDPAGLRWLLGSYCERMGTEIGESAEQEPSFQEIWCPYCSYRDSISKMATEETMAYVRRLVYREIVAPRMNQLFSGLEDSLGRERNSGGFLSVSIEFKHSRPILPVRPMHGPEPPDFNILKFLCCNKRIKVSESCLDVPLCSFCGAEVVLV